MGRGDPDFQEEHGAVTGEVDAFEVEVGEAKRSISGVMAAGVAVNCRGESRQHGWMAVSGFDTAA